MTGTTDTTGAAPRRRKTILIAAAAIAAFGVAAVYGIAALGGNAGDAACAGALATAKRIAPLARGEVAAVSVADTGPRLPALAALQQKLGGPAFEVVAVNIDTRNLDKPKAWLQEAGVTGLTYYADASARVFQELKSIGKAVGMPTSLLIDANGCEIAYLAGPAEWGSDDALKLVQSALQK